MMNLPKVRFAVSTRSGSWKSPFQTITHNLWLIISRWTPSPGILRDRSSFRNCLVELPALVELFCGRFGIFLAVERLQTQFVPLLFSCLTFLFLVLGEGMQFALISSLGENHQPTLVNLAVGKRNLLAPVAFC